MVMSVERLKARVAERRREAVTEERPVELAPPVKCPFCGSAMNEIPSTQVYSPLGIAERHPIRIIGKWVKKEIERQTSKISESVRFHECLNCGFVAMFKRKWMTHEEAQR